MGHGSVVHRVVPPIFQPQSFTGNKTIAPGLLHSISTEDENVQVIFLPSNTTSLLQPLDQGIISCIKASYTRQVFEMIRAAIDADPNLKVTDCWKSFTIADAVTFIKAAVDELKPETVNAWWNNLWSEAVRDFKGFLGIDGEAKKDHPNSKRSWWRGIRRHGR